MKHGIVIIGSGFAARQLVKNIRKHDAQVPVRMIAADSMDEYNKPDLSHVISLNQRACDLTRQHAGEFAEQFDLTLNANSWVSGIDTRERLVKCGDQQWQYDKLVLATGSRALLPPIEGKELMLTLNSQQEYLACESTLREAKRVMILGGGLIGTELAMDFCRAGKQVILVDNAASLLASLMPAEVSSRLQQRLNQMGVELLFNQRLESLSQTPQGIHAALSNGRIVTVDAVVAAIGLRPNVDLAQHAGLAVNRGIQVNRQLQTSDANIYALGDCAEIDGKVLPFLQPIQFSAMTLAKNLLGAADGLNLPAMLVKVKTPELPLHLAGETQRHDLAWQISTEQQGLIAKGYDEAQQLRAFIVSEAHMKMAFGLLRELQV
ncbi:NADH:flavorubredoxin reductase NorW [Buttiauxella gaviniae]|uniref:Nitric oxide reductase FlRd-NAD(+) reductase n=1 Tax=Buttiauxella gaviniae ATCC 51604 TaxID=1354253 RepID=A0A1B7HUG2_9ENTR|nr:NADH:flavorubredoxin reductase NorW [Buttiauxella gaviniae]OAT19309.1 nitric oxide reductase FlRd-NAD(+) reductase [Buttiauxella gaviniae ATCC 51604]